MTNTNQSEKNLAVVYVPVDHLINPDYNPRKWSEQNTEELKTSILRYGIVDPLLVNSADERKNIVIGGNFRLKVLKELGYTEVPVVYIHIPDAEKEKELCLRLNKNQGEWDIELLAKFDESFLEDIGFESEELDSIFEDDETETIFDLEKELEKVGIENVTVKKGDVYDLDGSRLMCGDSTVKSDMLALCGEHKIDMVMTDPPYILDYLHGKGKHGEAVTGFGAKKNRRYLETDVLPDNFTELWMTNVSKVQAPNFSIIVYENCKNIYLQEEALVEQLSEIIDKIDVDKIGIKYQLEQEVKRVNNFRNNVLGLNAEDKIKEIDIKAYAKYILKQGGIEEKRELMQSLKSRLLMTDKRIFIEN